MALARYGHGIYTSDGQMLMHSVPEWVYIFQPTLEMYKHPFGGIINAVRSALHNIKQNGEPDAIEWAISTEFAVHSNGRQAAIEEWLAQPNDSPSPPTRSSIRARPPSLVRHYSTSRRIKPTPLPEPPAYTPSPSTEPLSAAEISRQNVLARLESVIEPRQSKFSRKLRAPFIAYHTRLTPEEQQERLAEDYIERARFHRVGGEVQVRQALFVDELAEDPYIEGLAAAHDDSKSDLEQSGRSKDSHTRWAGKKIHPLPDGECFEEGIPYDPKAHPPPSLNPSDSAYMEEAIVEMAARPTRAPPLSKDHRRHKTPRFAQATYRERSPKLGFLTREPEEEEHYAEEFVGGLGKFRARRFGQSPTDEDSVSTLPSH